MGSNAVDCGTFVQGRGARRISPPRAEEGKPRPDNEIISIARGYGMQAPFQRSGRALVRAPAETPGSVSSGMRCPDRPCSQCPLLVVGGAVKP